DLLISGAVEMDSRRENYTEGDMMYINKGSSSGIKEGDIFLIIQEGEKVKSPINGQKLGLLYWQKSLAQVTCLYETSAMVVLRNSCHPVNIGDILIPFKTRPTIFKKKIDYKRCMLPNAVSGNVVFTSFFMTTKRVNVGPEEYVTIDMGKALVEEGNFVLFYTIHKKDIPPVIIGSGIIINAENSNSTVKVLEFSWPVTVGTTRVTLVPKSEEPISALTPTTEEIPTIEPSQTTEERTVEPGEETMDVNIWFGINENTSDMTTYADALEKIKAFIAPKKQYVVVLRGYACSIGRLEYNLKLSQERAAFVKTYLVNTLAIPENFIETYFYGEQNAPYDNSCEEVRKKNRLVNIQVIGK
ncbi:MAG TPA: OmpA family protein, partial [Candidatus Deferrimicrobium sp.]|nr:OmpA family protein [Candidatus Deferrimicrobium sp.]